MEQSINNPSMLKVGSILHGTYRIDSYLSSGGFGNTYVATNIEFDERVAIKEFFMKGVTQRDDNQTTVSVSNSENTNSFLEQKEKFKKEARRIRQLNNPHIVRVHDLFEENGTAYYVMDYVDGENLAGRLKRTGKPMTENEVNQILPQILDALKSIHNAGIWHLDLKPANIMVDKAGNVKLIDFGASKQLNAQKGGATTSTAISYTNGYAPREQMEQNYDKFGPWTDIYALGATLYNLLTNKRPPLPTDIDDDISEDKHEALPFPGGISKSMKDKVLRMMKTNRLQRPQNIDDIVETEKTMKDAPKQAPKQQPTPKPSADYDDEATVIAQPQPKKEEKTVESKAKEKYNQASLSDSHIDSKSTNSISNILFGSSIFRAICTIAIGVLLTMYPRDGVTWLIVTIGVLLLLSGIIVLIAYSHAKKHTGEYTFIDKQGCKISGSLYSFPVVGVFSVIGGLVLALTPGIFINALMYVLATIMIIVAINQLRNLSNARHFGSINILFWIAPSLVLLIGLFVILKPMESVELPLLILGWGSMFCGISEIVNTIKINFIIKNTKRIRFQRPESAD